MQQSPHWLQWDIPNSPTILPFPHQRLPPPSNTPIPQPTPLTNPNGMRIQSAVLSQYTFQTHIQTDRLTNRPTDGIGNRSTLLVLMLTILIKSNTLENNRLTVTSSELGFTKICWISSKLASSRDKSWLHSDSISGSISYSYTQQSQSTCWNSRYNIKLYLLEES